jgi:hypothetical protein
MDRFAPLVKLGQGFDARCFAGLSADRQKLALRERLSDLAAWRRWRQVAYDPLGRGATWPDAHLEPPWPAPIWERRH